MKNIMKIIIQSVLKVFREDQSLLEIKILIYLKVIHYNLHQEHSEEEFH